MTLRNDLTDYSSAAEGFKTSSLPFFGWKYLVYRAQEGEKENNRRWHEFTSILLGGRVAMPRKRLLLAQKLLEVLDQTGVQRPELWSANNSDWDNGSARILVNDHDIPIQLLRPWLPSWYEPIQVSTREYVKECQRLQATQAGRRAKRLLMHHLTDAQERDYYWRGIFIVASNPDSLGHFTYFIIDASYPNGNVFEIRKNEVIANYCFHPEEPYPLDDILLTQKLAIEEDGKAFKEAANRTDRSAGEWVVPTMTGYRMER